MDREKINTVTDWFMCPPDFFGVEYEINSWMEGNIGLVQHDVAQLQWQRLYKILQERGQVQLMPAAKGLPDLCFTANAGFVLGNDFILSHFRYVQRQGEEALFRQWFKERGYHIKKLPEGITFEGEGDALLQPNQELIWLGYNMRTSLDAQKPLEEMLDMEVVPLCLINPRFYHLDTCFVPLPEGRVIYYPQAFDLESKEKLWERIPKHNLWAVNDEDAMGFACNAIICGQDFICNHVTDELRAKLREWGFTVITVPLTEFMLAGGAAKCLALNLSQVLP